MTTTSEPVRAHASEEPRVDRSGWLGPLLVALAALGLRVWHLGRPDAVMFDETYYAKDAYSLLRHGYVIDFVQDANEKIIDGNLTGLWTGEPTWIVHPDGGKWVIALGEWLFGMNPFGWRIAAAVVGALTVLVLARMVRRMTGSTWIGCFAGALLALDGLHLTMSRIALLDVFLTFWLVCGVACLVAHRDWVADHLHGLPLWRPWQLAAGVCFGMAAATKWNALPVVAVFGLAVVVWEVLARRRAWRDAPAELRPPRRPAWVGTTLAVGVPAFFWVVVVGLVVYLASWTGFLVHHEAYEARFGHGYGDVKPWGAYLDTPASGFAHATDALRSLWHFHVMTYDFHTGSYLKGKTHPYQSNPFGWLVIQRPVSVEVTNDVAASRCGAPADSSCMRQVILLGNPVIWWTGAAALVASVVAWIRTFDWRWGVPVLGVLATWVPWWFNDERPIFYFYAVAILPFTIVAIALVMNHLRVTTAESRGRRRIVVGMAVVMLVATAAVTAFFWPILTDQLISYDTWRSRMWFGSWI